MNQPYIKFAKLNPKAIIPSKKAGNSGYDVYACIEHDYYISPHTTRLIPTGIASEIALGWTFLLEERGSTGSKGIKRSAGVIDSNYRGEWFVALTNANEKTLIISVNPEKTKQYLLNVRAKKAKQKFGDKFDFERWLNRYYIIYPANKAIAQALFVFTPHVDPSEVSYEELSKTDRGGGKLGSSGK